jgi:hypothetical protein
MKWICCGLALFISLHAYAEEATNITKLNTGYGYALDINGISHIALPAAKFKTLTNSATELKAENTLLLQAIGKLKAELASYIADSKEYRAAVKEVSEINKQYQELNNSYSDLSTKYSTTAGELVGLNKDYRAVVQEFDELTEKYRKVALRTNPRSKWDFGLGMLKPTASGSDPHYFASVGTGAKLLNAEVRGWLLVGDDSYGLMAGISF